MKNSIRIVLCSIFMLLSYCMVNAQTARVKWGATISDEKQTKFNIIGEDEKSVYVLRFQHDRRNMSIPFFVILDRKTLQETKSVAMEIPIPDDGDASMNEVYFLKDRFVIMITLTNRKSKQDAALAYLMDKTGKISPNFKVVLENKEAPRNEFLRYYFLISPDSTRFMAVIYDNVKSNHMYNVAVFDSDLNSLWKTEFSLNEAVKAKSIAPISLTMDMNADLFIMVKASSKNIYSNELGNKLVIYKNKEKQIRLYDVLPPDKLQAYEMGQFLSDIDGNTWFTGMYGEKDTDAKGVAIASYNKEGKFQAAYKPFSNKFRTAFMSDSKAAKGEPVDFLVIDYVLLNKDKSFVVTMHKYAPRAFVAAAAIKFDKDMNEAWSAPLPIYFWMVDAFFTYAPLLTDKEVCFVYNDHKKNIDTVDPRESNGLNDLDNAICVITRVDLETGTVKKNALSGTEDTYLMPAKCYQASEKEMLLFAKRKANVNFGKLTLD
jgi:hypothetical protein